MQVDKIAGPLPLYPSEFNQKDNRIPMVTGKPGKILFCIWAGDTTALTYFGDI